MRGREKERECERYKKVRIDEERNIANIVNKEGTEKQLQLLKSLPSLKKNFALYIGTIENVPRGGMTLSNNVIQSWMGKVAELSIKTTVFSHVKSPQCTAITTAEDKREPHCLLSWSYWYCLHSARLRSQGVLHQGYYCVQTKWQGWLLFKETLEGPVHEAGKVKSKL